MSPRSGGEDDPQQIKDNQRKLSENIRAQYVNNIGSGLNSSRINTKHNSTRIDEKLLCQNQVASNSNSCNSGDQAALARRKKQQSNLKKSSLLAKSLVEDASEDFSNIEEHISSFYNQQTIQTGNPATGGLAGTTEDQRKPQVTAAASLAAEANNQIVDNKQFQSILPADVVSRTQALRQEAMTGTNFGSTLDNQSQYDENENQYQKKGQHQQSPGPYQSVFLGSSSSKLKRRPYLPSQQANQAAQESAKMASSSANTSGRTSAQRVNHNAINISQTYGQQVPKTLFSKVIDGLNTSQHHGRDTSIS